MKWSFKYGEYRWFEYFLFLFSPSILQPAEKTQEVTMESVLVILKELCRVLVGKKGNGSWDSCLPSLTCLSASTFCMCTH